MQETRYGIRTRLPLSFDEAVAAARGALQNEGFGVLCEIDVKAKMKEKLGVDFANYLILGACNPPLAYRALNADRDIGLLLPCNVVVYEEKPGACVIAAINPDAMMEVAGNSELRAVAKEARERLVRALENVAAVRTA